ncbi:hypothetical protein SAMN05192555_10591 [Franzmannia pantelleriensis]|uniref:Uncharacterized protein n=1 Tax=Franzmannia pantelleriensis TaxID=48727 RepID=A0A1G9KYB9_9GAMM|nr:hypothetical protein SAMN05192555_10591 [Halomonas pantelleriensis]
MKQNAWPGMARKYHLRQNFSSRCHLGNLIFTCTALHLLPINFILFKTL